MQFPVHTMQNMTWLKTVRSLMTLFVVAGCLSLPILSSAGIGAESNNQAAVSAQTTATVPSYPGTSSGMTGTIFPAASQSVSPYGEIPSYLLYNAQQSPYGSMLPYGAQPQYETQYGTAMPYNYGTLPQYGTYGTMSPYDTMPGMQYPQTGMQYPQTGMQYPQTGMQYPQTGMQYPQTGMQYPQTGMFPGMTMPSYGGLPGAQPSTGDPAMSSYPLPYTQYDPMQAYPGSQQGGWYPQYPYGSQSPYGAQSADDLYNKGMQAYRSQDYWTALTNFQQVASLFPQGDLADNAYYWSGEIYLAWKNYPMAIQAFQTVLYSYPNGNKVPDAHVKLGLAYMDMRQYQMARAILSDVSTRYADNKRIRDLATKKLNELNNLYYY